MGMDMLTRAHAGLSDTLAGELAQQRLIGARQRKKRPPFSSIQINNSKHLSRLAHQQNWKDQQRHRELESLIDCQRLNKFFPHITPEKSTLDYYQKINIDFNEWGRMKGLFSLMFCL